MARAGAYVPVPRVLRVVPPDRDGGRPAMVLEYVPGTLLSDVLSASVNGADTARLGAEAGRVIAGIGTVTFGRAGFFADPELAVGEMPPWSQQLPEMAATCMDAVPPERLDLAARKAWIELCVANAPALGAISAQARLVHADANPKNILVTRVGTGWRVDAVLDWEFSFSGLSVRRLRQHGAVQRRLPRSLYRRLPLGIRRAPATRPAPRQGLGLPRPRPGHVRAQRPGYPPGRTCRGRPGGRANSPLDQRRHTGRAWIIAGARAGSQGRRRRTVTRRPGVPGSPALPGLFISMVRDSSDCGF
jgi:hypothetical protein